MGEFFAPTMVGDEVLATRTVIDRYAKRGRLYMVCEVIFTHATSGQLLARQRHHQSFVEDQSPESVVAWRNGTSSKKIGKVIAKERVAPPEPDASGVVLEKFGP